MDSNRLSLKREPVHFSLVSARPLPDISFRDASSSVVMNSSSSSPSTCLVMRAPPTTAPLSTWPPLPLLSSLPISLSARSKLLVSVSFLSPLSPTVSSVDSVRSLRTRVSVPSTLVSVPSSSNSRYPRLSALVGSCN